MKSNLKLQKALLLLDREKQTEGEECLKSAILTAEEENDEIILATASSSLGELYFLQERIEEAIPLLEKISRIEREDDLLNYEITQAREILQQIQS
jgi:tetratricopeptide (TPR) repeat protein